MKKELLILLLAFLTLPFITQAQDILYASDAMSDDEFGYTVSMHGDFAAITAQRSDALGSQSGAVYIYQYNGTNWMQTQKITAFDGTAWDYFGTGLKIDENYLIIGNYFDDDADMNCGSAYIYKKNGSTWDYEAKVVADDASNGDWAGYDVDINDNFAVVGARGDNDASGTSNLDNTAGAAYVYKNNGDGTWSQVQKLAKDTPNFADNFGYGVEISGDYIFVGAPRQINSGGNRGSVYIYKKNSNDTFDYVTELQNTSGTSDDQFGLRIDASNDHVIILSEGGGVVYQLENDTWGYETTLETVTGNEGFIDVKISDEYALLSDGSFGAQTIDLYRFNGSEWIFVETFSPSNNDPNQRFAHSFDLANGQILAGAPRNGTQASTAGATFVFDYTFYPTSVDQIIESDFEVFPNPATNVLNLKLDHSTIQDIRVYNSVGQLVINKKYNGHINVSSLAKGQFVIQVMNTEGKMLTSKFSK